MNTVYGAAFSHKGETAGTRAEIAAPVFADQFKGKQLYEGGFRSIAVVKRNAKGALRVDGISGGTMTSNGVQHDSRVVVKIMGNIWPA